MRSGDAPDGAPALLRRMGAGETASVSHVQWRETMTEAFDSFRESLSMAERFGGAQPWLDAYAAQDPAEFFAVTCEAYFVNRPRFAVEFPSLVTLYDAFFRPDQRGS
jgi:Mlc titration factor MtfA (ptsG expression regulator)